VTKRITSIVAATAAALFVACATVPRDAGMSDVQQAVATRTNQTVDLSAQANEERVRAMLADDLTPDEAVAIAVANNPRLQATLAELGIARADLIEPSTITNPVFEFEWRVPGEPYHPYELRLAQSLIELIQLPRRRAIGRAAFDAAQMRQMDRQPASLPHVGRPKGHPTFLGIG